MRKIREILRLKWVKGLSNWQIARTCGVGRPTVAEYLRRATKVGLGWPLPGGLDEAALERQLFPPPPVLPAQTRGVPDWVVVHQEFKRKGVTVFLLWQEYRETHPKGLTFRTLRTQFPGNYREHGLAVTPGSCRRSEGRRAA